MKILHNSGLGFNLEETDTTFDSQFFQVFFMQLGERLLHFSPTLIRKRQPNGNMKENVIENLFDGNIFAWLVQEWVCFRKCLKCYYNQFVFAF